MFWKTLLKLINNSWRDQPINDVYFAQVDETWYPVKQQMKTRRVLISKHTCVCIKITMTKAKISILLFIFSNLLQYWSLLHYSFLFIVTFTLQSKNIPDESIWRTNTSASAVFHLSVQYAAKYLEPFKGKISAQPHTSLCIQLFV